MQGSLTDHSDNQTGEFYPDLILIVFLFETIML